MRPFLIPPVFLLVGSCVLGPEPGSPGIKTPASIRGDSAPQGASFGDHAWCKVFSDPTLRSLIARALRNNQDLVAATYRIEQALAQAGATRAAGFPQLQGAADAGLNYRSQNSVSSSASRKSESYGLTGQLSWELDLWGAIRRNNQAARARLLEAGYQRDAVQTSLVAAVASAYIELKTLDEQLAISRRTIESRQSSLDLVIARRDGGVSSDLEVGQAEALLSQARITVPLTQRNIAAKENEIRLLLGDFPGAITRGASLDHLSSSLRIAGGLPSSLLQRRPDLAAADQAFQAATAEIGVAEALRLPSLALTGNGGLTSNALHSLLQGRSAAFSIGPQLTGPIFDAGRARFGADAARANAGIALASYQKTALQAFQEAADALDSYGKTGEIIAEQTRLVDSQKNVSSLALDRFQAGASSYLEVLDAERGLFTAELDLADARSNRLKSVVQAYRALGGGWK